MVQQQIKAFIRNPKKALLRLSFPMLIAMVVQATYHIVDTAFVGRLGANAIAALTFAFPLFFIMIALTSGLGIGMGSRISRLLGAKNKKEAENTAMHGLIIGLILGVLVFIIGMVSVRPLFTILGATPEVVELAVGYMKIILAGSFVLFPGYVFVNIFIGEGNTKIPMKIQILALGLNLVLDPIFIYSLNLGVKGAALATLISYCVAFVLSLYYIIRKSYLKLNLKSFNYSPRILKEILTVGAPASLMMIFMSVYIIFINKFMAHYGTNYVASFGLVSRLESFAIMPVYSISSALVTLVGMFHGAKKHDLIKKLTRYTIKICVLFSIGMGFIFFLFPAIFLRVFTTDPILLGLSSAYFRVSVFTFPFLAISIIISRAMQGKGSGIAGLITNVVNIFVVAIPFAYLFVFVLSYNYLWVAFSRVLGSIGAAAIAFLWYKFVISNHD